MGCRGRTLKQLDPIHSRRKCAPRIVASVPVRDRRSGLRTTGEQDAAAAPADVEDGEFRFACTSQGIAIKVLPDEGFGRIVRSLRTASSCNSSPLYRAKPREGAPPANLSAPPMYKSSPHCCVKKA